MSRGLVIALSALAVVALAVVGYGVSQFRMSSVVPEGATKSQQFRTSYVEGAIRSCIPAAQASAPAAPKDKIESYCGCVANGTVDLIGDDDVKYMLDHPGTMPPSFQAKAAPVAGRCLKSAGLG